MVDTSKPVHRRFGRRICGVGCPPRRNYADATG